MRRIFSFTSFALFACYSLGEGISPPLASIYFPTGLALSQDSKFLYVVNSDFDLQYNAGTVQSLDLTRIRSFIPRGCSSDSDCPSDKYCDIPQDASDNLEHSFWCVARAGNTHDQPCGVFGEQSSSSQVTVPGRCLAVNLQNPQDGASSLVVDAVAIGAFATDVISREFPSSYAYAERLFIPVRGESSLNWIDVAADGKLSCGQDSARACDQQHRAGQDPSDNSRGVKMPPEPYAIAATPDASAILVTHQTQGALSLLVNDWTQGPILQFVYTGLPPMPIATIAMPQPALVQLGFYSAAPDFLVAYETTARMDLFRFSSDAQSTPARPYLELSASASVTAISGGYDVRGIAVDDSQRLQCESQAAASNSTCISSCATDADSQSCQSACQVSYSQELTTCANVPVDAYASSRAPASLLIGHTTPNTLQAPNSDLPYINDAVSLPTGPSRIQVGHIINAAGQLETRIFVVCFDSRRLAIYDPITQNVESWVITGRGPQAIAFDVVAPSPNDEGHAYAFVGQFTDSYIAVIELDRRRGRSYGSVVLNLGTAVPPRTSK